MIAVWTALFESVRNECSIQGGSCWIVQARPRHHYCRTQSIDPHKSYGIDAAGAVLGHTRLETSQIYAERSVDLAVRVARETG
jgi:hypothetical protein